MTDEVQRTDSAPEPFSFFSDSSAFVRKLIFRRMDQLVRELTQPDDDRRAWERNLEMLLSELVKESCTILGDAAETAWSAGALERSAREAARRAHQAVGESLQAGIDMGLMHPWRIGVGPLMDCCERESPDAMGER